MACRKVAASCFLELLVLKTKGYVQLEQSEPFADIIVTQDELMIEA
jgi:chromatin segregation and condensation protein Rec8/ScpA/Scc1 (kleisin family)